jgi:AraC-like DNA-binding protein
MKVERFQPCDRLAPYVKEFIVIDTDAEVQSTALPDTSVVMAFRLKGSVAYTKSAQEIIPASSIAGLRKSVRYFSYQPKTSNILVLFKEGAFRYFSNIPANNLFDLTISNENVFRPSELEEMLEQFAEGGNHRKRISLLESKLISKMIIPKPDPMIALAIQRIKVSYGMVKMNDLVDSLSISHDPFEKRFRAAVGSTPKQFASIVRLRHAIGQYHPGVSLTTVALDAGYFDQSHFIKDFRMFTGESPKQFFRSARFW